MTTAAPASRRLSITRDPITRLWFWHCRLCSDWPTVGHATTQPGALNLAALHADSTGHQAAGAEA